MSEQEALNLIKKYVKNKNSIKHMLATAAVMRSLAQRFNEDENKWALAGLLHDIDMEIVNYQENPHEHGLKGAQILEEEGVDKDIINAALAHNKETGKKRETLLEKSIFCTDPLTGLIVASTLVLPSKKLAYLTPESVLKRYKEKSFARGADREIIASCSDISISLEEFVTTGLIAMQKISDDLDL